MANERTLFERILDPSKRVPRSSRERKEMLTQSIIAHLKRVLNSREGCCQTLADYGMPDIESRSGSRNDLQRDLELALRDTIQKYEPRLRRIVVRLEESDELKLVPKFTVSAELAPRDDYAKDISFTTMVDPSGSFKVG